MTFFPEAFDPRSDVVGALNLALVNTPDGDFGFMVGVDGRFVDTMDRVYWGSQLIGQPRLEMAINGVAPSGEITLSFFQDPDAENLIEQIRELGIDYIEGRDITFFVQPISNVEDFYSPPVAPIQLSTRRMTALTFSVTGADQRSVTLSFEGPFEDRKNARRLVYNTEDHARLIGSDNPSLSFIPRERDQEEKLFG